MTAMERIPRFLSLIGHTSTMLVSAFVVNSLLLNALLRAALIVPTLVIAYKALIVDSLVGRVGSPQAAAQWLMADWNLQTAVEGLEHVPATGPLLIVCNHAGWGDAMAVWAMLPRTDVYTVVKKNGLLRGMPCLVSHMIVVEDGREIAAVRGILDRLKGGNAVLLFPRGAIEPDPALDVGGAVASLEGWSDTLGMLMRRLDDLRILPVVVGGVLSRAARGHPLVQLYKKPAQRDFLAATLQLMFHIYHDVAVQVKIGCCIDSTAQAPLVDTRREMARLLTTFDHGEEGLLAGRVESGMRPEELIAPGMGHPT